MAEYISVLIGTDVSKDMVFNELKECMMLININ